MSDDPYLYPGTTILRNKLGIFNEHFLELLERQATTERGSSGVPRGNFNLAHLKAIHRHLFQDIYDWAGKIRTVEIAKGGNQFQFRHYIETGMADVHARLVKQNFLQGLSPDRFAGAAAVIIGDVNYIHPFREGNGRTQVYYLQQLCQGAGYELLIGQMNPKRWLAASRASFTGDYGLMAACIRQAMA